MQVLGCVFSTVSALAHGEIMLAVWSLSALATSALALWLLHCRRDLYLRSSLRDWLYTGMRLHRAYAIVGMRRWVGELARVPPVRVVQGGLARGDASRLASGQGDLQQRACLAEQLLQAADRPT